MTSELRTVTIVPLNGKKTILKCKVQCRMVMMRDELWDILRGKEDAPYEEEAAKYLKSSWLGEIALWLL